MSLIFFIKIENLLHFSFLRLKIKTINFICKLFKYYTYQIEKREDLFIAVLVCLNFFHVAEWKDRNNYFTCYINIF